MITIFNLIGGFGGGPETNVYPQDAPTFSSPETLVAADASSPGILFTADLNGADDIILSGNWVDALSFNAISGELGVPKRFVNENSSVLIGTESKAASALSVIGVVNNIELWGKDKDTPLRGSAGSGQSGVVLNPVVGGAIHRIYNIAIKNVGYSGYLLTAPSSGGSYYKKTIGAHLKVEGLVTEGEGWYSGHVTTSTPNNSLILVHVAGKDKGRNGFQHKWGTKTRAYNHTYRNVAQVADTAQNQAFQIEVSADTIMYDFIFDGVKYPFNLFTHDLIVDGGFTRFTVGAGYIGESEDFWPGNPNLNGIKVIFKNHTFIFDNAGTAYLAQWAETGCDLEFQNCRFSDNINSAIVQDIRGGSPTNSLIGTTTTNGNTSVAKATLLAEIPLYKSDDVNNKDFNYLFPGTKWFNLGVGAGSPTRRTLQILDGKEDVSETVVYGTAFGDLTLPSTGEFLLSTGKWVTLSITWAAGSYDGDVAGDYTIEGTPTSSYGNSDDIKVEKVITVEVYVNPDTVRVNLAGTGGAYTSSGNWNNIFQNFGSGDQTIKGDNSGETLASLRKVGGSLTGYQLNIVTGFDSGALGQAAGGVGVYPDNAILGNWSNPGSAGTSRSFKLTGLDNAKTYTIRILGSAADYLSGTSHLVTVQVSGASGGGTLSNQEIEANISNVMTFPGCVPTGGEITIRVEKTATGQAYVNVLDFEWS